MRTRALLLTVFALSLLAPTTAADYSILGGTIIVHTNGDPGATVTPAASTVRVDPDACAVSGCVLLYGSLMGEPFNALAAAVTCTSAPPPCVIVLAAADGSVAGMTVVVVAAGLLQECNPRPANCAVIITGADTTVVGLVIYRNAEITSVCTDPSATDCVAATTNLTAEPNQVVACVGAGETTIWYEAPPVTCDGLLVSTSPLCIERASDGFHIICEVRSSLPEPALP